MHTRAHFAVACLCVLIVDASMWHTPMPRVGFTRTNDLLWCCRGSRHQRNSRCSNTCQRQCHSLKRHRLPCLLIPDHPDHSQIKANCCLLQYNNVTRRCRAWETMRATGLSLAMPMAKECASHTSGPTTPVRVPWATRPSVLVAYWGATLSCSRCCHSTVCCIGLRFVFVSSSGGVQGAPRWEWLVGCLSMSLWERTWQILTSWPRLVAYLLSPKPCQAKGRLMFSSHTLSCHCVLSLSAQASDAPACIECLLG